MQYLFMTLFAAAAVGLDQIVKQLVLSHIALYGHVDFLPGVLGLTYVQNPGAAFSSFEGAQWLFAVIFLLFAAFILWEFPKKRMPFTNLERWLIVGIFAGGVGNTIDRFRFGYVVDMFQTEFMDFPVFNVADIFITCCCIWLIAHLIFCNREFWKDGKKK